MATHYITFTYSAAGGSGAPGTQTFTCVTARYPRTFTATISSVKPTRAYYSFLGWSTTAGASTASYASGQTLSFTFSTSTQGDVTRNFYAVWKRNTAYVYYNANGGTGAPSTQSHNAGTSVALSGTKPTRAGYIFLGWATSATATAKQYDAGQANVPLYTTTTLYAVWKTAASSLSASNGDLGDALTITITREVNTYTDTITWNFGTQSGTIATKTSAGSVSWTPAVSLASEFPNSASGPCVLTCTTYNGDTLIGTTTKTITLTVPQSLAPTVSVSYADTIAQCLTWGLLVQSRSKLAFTITASGQQGATIASYSTSVNGTSYNSASFTTDVLLYNGSNSYTVTVTDSRGLQTVSTGTFSVVAYSNPSLTLTLCDRNDSDPDQVDIGFDFSVASVSSNNDAKYRLDYKLKSASTWTNGTVQSLGAYSGSISDLIANLDGGDEWDIRINVIDSFQTASVESEVGVAGNILLNSRHNGGLGLLMKSQADNQLDIGKPTVHHGAVLEQFGSTVKTHSTSGNYAKVLTFGTNVTVGKNLAPVNSWNTGRRWWGSNINSAGLLGSVLETLPAGTYTLSWKYTLTAIPSDPTTTLQVGKYVRVKYDGSYHILSSYSLTTIPTYTVGDTYSVQATITIDADAVGQSFEVLGYCGQSDSFYATLTEYQIEVGSEKTPFEPYVNTNDINVNAPITIEYAKTGDVSPTTLTIVFNRDYSLQSFTKNASADAYLHNSSTARWNLYIGKSSSSDSVEILDFHNPWSNTDMTIDWDDTAVSTLPTGTVQAESVNTNIEVNANAVSVANGTWTNTGSITLTKGTWIITAFAQFATNTTGRRQALISETSASSTSVRGMMTDNQAPVDGAVTLCRFMDIYTVTSATKTLYLNSYQNSGSTMNVYGRIYAIKIV